jgi:hypothetical protein
MRWVLRLESETSKEPCGCAFLDGYQVMVCPEHNEQAVEVSGEDHNQLTAERVREEDRGTTKGGRS